MGQLGFEPGLADAKAYTLQDFILNVLTFTVGSLKSKGIQAILSEVCSRLPVGRSGQGLQGPVGKEFGFLRNQPPSPPPAL